MEALVRISTMIALPIDSDLEEIGCSHSGEYITMLHAEGPAAVSAFLELRRVGAKGRRRREWGRGRECEEGRMRLGELGWKGGEGRVRREMERRRE